MEDIVEYFTDIYHLDKHTELPLGVVNKLNELDRVERGELKSRLFTEAKRLVSTGDGIRAIRWLESTFAQIEKYSFRLHEVLFSPGQDIPENIAFYLSQAKKSIDLCVYTISDERLCQCLKTIHEKGIAIRLITDNNKMRDAGSQVKELARAGISVKIDNSRYHMHNKFGIIDNRIAFTGSYNWTYTAMTHNQENLVITTNFTIVHKFIDEFATLWEEMFWLRVRQSKEGHMKVKVDKSRLSGSRREGEESDGGECTDASQGVLPPLKPKPAPGNEASPRRERKRKKKQAANGGNWQGQQQQKKKKRKRSKWRPGSPDDDM